jgi:N-acetylglucosaminyldiphosphoundecaprenol N-acetyl-beta-D-mannosaminyltransferase
VEARDGVTNFDDGFPRKASVVGVPISMTSYEEVIARIEHRAPDVSFAVAVCNVHSVMTARRHPELRAALEGAEIATSDGMPLVWTLRSTARPGQGRVYGPELMRRALTHGQDRGWGHYLFGSTPETLKALVASIAETAPAARVVGTEAPPFRPLTDDEESAIVDRIRASGADIVWVGLGMPKQELWMHRVKGRLAGVALIGVGAAFDFLAGRVRQAPPWMQRAGLEWLFRLSQEPRRLWRRYILNNPAFLALMAAQIVRHRWRRLVRRDH